MTGGRGATIDVETVSANSLEPVCAVDPEGRVAFANERFLAITQQPRDAVVGADFERFRRFVDDGFGDVRDAVEVVVSGAQDDRRVELSMDHPAGAPVPRHLPAEVRDSSIREDGAILGALLSFRNVTRRKEHERDLRRQNERLEEFASVVSHDLRNPLTVAKGNLRLAVEEEDCDHLSRVDRALDRMTKIIEGTLTLARQGLRVGEAQTVALPSFVERCWGNVDTGGCTLRVDAEVSIRADPDRLQHLFENLFRNSVEHSSTGSRPQVDDRVEHGSTGPRASPEDDAEPGGDRVTVSVGPIDGDGFYVEDDGRGVPDGVRESLFELGYTTQEEGTGFGLAIVRRIAEAHGWDVGVSEGTDGGARFEFTGVERVED